MNSAHIVTRLVAAVALLSSSMSVFAKPEVNCWVAAAHRYGLPVELLYAIGQVESNHKPRAIGVNSNGSRDLGIMQINDMWLPTLRKYGITAADLLNKPCTNIQVGAWILAQEVKRTGYTWYSIGAYNAGPITPKLSEKRRAAKLATYRKYTAKVFARWKAIREQRAPASPAITEPATAEAVIVADAR